MDKINNLVISYCIFNTIFEYFMKNITMTSVLKRYDKNYN